jgi:hypothetical protein
VANPGPQLRIPCDVRKKRIRRLIFRTARGSPDKVRPVHAVGTRLRCVLNRARRANLKTTSGALAGDSGMTSPNATEPPARAEPPQTPPPAAAVPAGAGNRLAWLDVLRGLAALCVVFNHFRPLRAAAVEWPRLPVGQPRRLRRLRLLPHQRVHRARVAGTQGQRADVLGQPRWAACCRRPTSPPTCWARVSSRSPPTWSC